MTKITNLKAWRDRVVGRVERPLEKGRAPLLYSDDVVTAQERESLRRSPQEEPPEAA